MVVHHVFSTIKLHAELIDKVKERIEGERKEAERAVEAARKKADRIAQQRATAEEQARKEAEAWR